MFFIPPHELVEHEILVALARAERELAPIERRAKLLSRFVHDDTALDTLGMSTRLLNVLWRADLRRVGDLFFLVQMYGIARIVGLRGMGKKSYVEMVRSFVTYGVPQETFDTLQKEYAKLF